MEIDLEVPPNVCSDIFIRICGFAVWQEEIWKSERYPGIDMEKKASVLLAVTAMNYFFVSHLGKAMVKPT